MIQGHGGDIVTGDLVKSMWDIWKSQEETQDGEFIEDDPFTNLEIRANGII